MSKPQMYICSRDRILWRKVRILTWWEHHWPWIPLNMCLHNNMHISCCDPIDVIRACTRFSFRGETQFYTTINNAEENFSINAAKQLLLLSDAANAMFLAYHFYIFSSYKCITLILRGRPLRPSSVYAPGWC